MDFGNKSEKFIKKVITLAGDAGKKWLSDLPQIIKQYEKSWNVVVLAPFILSYNYVARARMSDGTRVVLKITYPGNNEFSDEIEALRFFDGNGAINVLQQDLKNRVMLLEMAEPGRSVSGIGNDRKAISIAVEVIKKLHKPIKKDRRYAFPTISSWAKAFDMYKKKFSGKSGPVPKRLLDKAEGIFKEYIKNTKRTVLLHGDLHNDNILSSQRGWLAIDPKGVIAEPELEAAAFLRNPYYDLPRGSNYKNVESLRIIQFSEELGFEKEQVLNWTFVTAILSLLWFLEDENRFSKLYLQNAELLNEIKF